MDVDKTLAQALSFHQLGDLAQAKKLYEDILLKNPNHADCLHLLGMISDNNNQITQAIELIKKAIMYRPESPVFHNNLATIYENQGELKQAQVHYQEALKLAPNYADAATNLANVYLKNNQGEQAIELLQQVINQHPEHILAHYNLAKVYQHTHRIEAALQCYLKLLKIDPNYLPAYVNLGTLLHAQHKLQDAYNCYNYVVIANPTYVEAQYNLAITLLGLGQVEQALDYLLAAHQQDPTHIKTLLKLGEYYLTQNKLNKANYYFAQAHSMDPYNSYAISFYAYSLKHLADWSALEYLAPELFKSIKQEILYQQPVGIVPRVATKIAIDDEQYHQIVQHYTKYLTIIGDETQPEYDLRTDILVIGYVAVDFNQQHLAQIILPLLQNHNYEKVEVHCYDLGLTDADTVQAIQATAAQYHKLTAHSYVDAIAKIRSDNISILLDLSGLRQGAWPQLFAAKAAPIQCHYLAHAGSQCVDYYQYKISFAELEPKQSKHLYTEKVYTLDHSLFAINPIITASDNRAVYHLPQDKIIYACLNSMSTVDNELFKTWCELIEPLTDAILWLYAPSNLCQENLRHMATLYGLTADKLYFCTDDDPLQTSAFTHVDIYLNSRHYYDDLEAVYAAWHGKPIISLQGQTSITSYPAMINMMCHQEQYIASDLNEYKKLAENLANPEQLALVQKQLLAQRDSLVIFDTKRFCHEFEQALIEINQLENSHER